MKSLGVLIFSIVASALLLAAMAFQWNLVDWVTPFLALPVLGFVWLLVIAGFVWAVVHAVIHRRGGVKAFLPLSVIACAVVLAFVVPFTQLWLYANFHLHKVARERVVAEVHSGALLPNVSYNSNLITLPPNTGVSMGGDQIMVQGKQKNSFVFFFTYRGILDNYSGFLWVPSGESPRQFLDDGEAGTEIVAFGGNWYFVGHH